jgi:riboflavin biosynthesis pyrimidine reductase
VHRQLRDFTARGIESALPETLGRPQLSRSLLEACLIDRFRVAVFPVITGTTGRERIYDG